MLIDKVVEIENSRHMRLHKYESNDQYEAIQKRAAKRKWERVWTCKENIKHAVTMARAHNDVVCDSVLCHGVRNGAEVDMFRECGMPAWGTEILPKCEHPHVFYRNFEVAESEFVNRWGMIYSNSWDHMRQPKFTFNLWLRQLKLGGIMALEHSSRHHACATSETDPFGVDLEVFPFLLLGWLRSHAAVLSITDLPKTVSPDPTEHNVLILLERRQ